MTVVSSVKISALELYRRRGTLFTCFFGPVIIADVVCTVFEKGDTRATFHLFGQKPFVMDVLNNFVTVPPKLVRSV